MIQFPVSLKSDFRPFLFLVWFFFNSCFNLKEFESVPLGHGCRGVLFTGQISGGKIFGDDRDIKILTLTATAFTFDIGKDSLDKLFVEFYNGSEK
ncbi:MAG: hypothetical protein IPL63_14500 [Saprospiraceae bacterium]|nr:hypothetical protein [Saprospiraceae bacterium]